MIKKSLETLISLKKHKSPIPQTKLWQINNCNINYDIHSTHRNTNKMKGLKVLNAEIEKISHYFTHEGLDFKAEE